MDFYAGVHFVFTQKAGLGGNQDIAIPPMEAARGRAGAGSATDAEPETMHGCGWVVCACACVRACVYCLGNEHSTSVQGQRV